MRLLLAKLKGGVTQQWKAWLALLSLCMVRLFWGWIYKIIGFVMPGERPQWQALATTFAGTVALLALYTNKRLQEQQFESKALNDEFTDILNRFADNDNTIMRANAAIRLAEMARRRWPGKPRELTGENYRFFPRAASQLAAALHLEQEQAVRNEVRKALDRMTEFAQKDEQTLLHIQIAELADANRSAKKAFIKALARYCLFNANDEPLETFLKPLVGFAPFCEKSELTLICLRNLAESEACRKAIDVAKTLQDANGVASKKKAHKAAPKKDECLSDIQFSAARLMDTNIALAHSLKALRHSSITGNVPKFFRKWITHKHVKLEDCFLTGADLSKMQLVSGDMSRVHLEGAIFDEAGLQKTEFESAYMQQSRLYKAQLKKSNLQKANLEYAYFKEANLEGAYFGGARLKNAYLESANLQGVNLNGTILEQVNLDNAHLQGVDLRGAFLKDVSLIKTDLQYADLRNATLEQVNLYGVRLNKAQLQEAKLTGVDLSGADLCEADLSMAQLQNADLSTAHLQNAILIETHFEGANLYRANLEGARLWRAHLEQTSLSEARLQGAELEEAWITKASLRNAILERAKLGKAHLDGADLDGAQMQGADLEAAKLRGATLRGANLSKAKLREVQMSEARLEKACLDSARLEGADLKQAILTGTNLDDAVLEAHSKDYTRKADFTGANWWEAQCQATIRREPSEEKQPGWKALLERLQPKRTTTNEECDGGQEWLQKHFPRTPVQRTESSPDLSAYAVVVSPAHNEPEHRTLNQRT